jgi:hypothetical protein
MRRATRFPPRFRSQAYPPCGEPPLSGFLADPSFAALFHAATVPGIPLPFRVFPSQKSRTPLGATCSLAVIHQRAGALLPGPCCRRFRRRPRFLAQLPDSPADYGLPFHAPKHASRSPWVQAAESLRSASLTRFEALILLRVRSHRLELPRDDGRSSLGVAPL